jgi:glycosyltransferase involved in cell wall biosynthesis
MQAADGFVLTSLWEGLPMALLEAAACGLPAVATDVLGTREVVRDGETGWLASGGNTGALAERMSFMMTIPAERRKAMGERARHSVIERFSLNAVLHRWEDLYRELLSRNPAPKRSGHRPAI